MSKSEAPDLDELAFQLAEACEGAVEAGDLDRISENGLTSALNALMRILAARAQEDRAVDLGAGNNRLSATDAVIACTAVLESASIEVFELAAWQAMSSRGSSKRSASTPSHGKADR